MLSVVHVMNGVLNMDRIGSDSCSSLDMIVTHCNDLVGIPHERVKRPSCQRHISANS